MSHFVFVFVFKKEKKEMTAAATVGTILSPSRRRREHQRGIITLDDELKQALPDPKEWEEDLTRMDEDKRGE